jgi:predicted alpha/beta-fold hydrolase
VVTSVGALAQEGVASVALNFRSCSGEPNRMARLYHSGETEDTKHVLRILRGRWPSRPLGALGFSLGGNVLLKLLGEGEPVGEELVQAASAVSVPFDLAAGAAYMEKGYLGGIYARYFLGLLKGKVEAKQGLLEPLLDLDRVFRARTLWEFDDAATAPLHGFEDAADYYGRSSCNQFLGGVRVPTLLLHARNDPFLPPEAIPYQRVAANPSLIPAFTSSGGHVGFVSGRVPWRPAYWTETAAARFLREKLRP